MTTFSPKYKWYALALMAAVYGLSLTDRAVMAISLQAIKHDLQLSDTQLGFVTGIAFALFYATLGVPISRWADRGNRATIASAAIGLWGLTVMACLFVTSFTHLVAARISAAVGEAGCKPPTYSLTGDYFPQPAERTRALVAYMGASLLPAVLGYTLGGWLNSVHGWRNTFFLIGIPGLLLAILFKLTVVEPRQCIDPQKVGSRPVPSFGAVLTTLWSIRSCRHLMLSLILIFTMSQGLVPWDAAFLMRTHGMGSTELGVWLGIVLSFGSLGGTLLGGYVIDRWFAGNEQGQLRLTSITVSVAFLFFVIYLLSPFEQLALIAMIPKAMVLASFIAPVYALLQRLVPNDMRATTLAVVMLLANLIGMGLGPQLVGVLSDLMRPVLGTDSLRYAMLTLACVILAAGRQFWLASRTVEHDLAMAAAAAA